MLNFDSYIVARAATGSRYICKPAPQNTDNDTLLLVCPGYEHSLQKEGFQHNCNEVEYATLGDFRSWRRGVENYIITEKSEFFDKFKTATEIARVLNLVNKSDRIKLFQAILYNNYEG